MKVLIIIHRNFELWNAPAWFVEKLREEFPQIEFIAQSSKDSLEPLADSEIVLTYSLRPEQFKTAKKLKWIHSPSAAVHQFIFPELVQSDVILTNGRDVHGAVVAEHVIALIY